MSTEDKGKMFKDLRNRLILINLSVTTIVILVVFSTIYLTSTRSAEMRRPEFENLQMNIDFDGDGAPDTMETIISTSIHEEKQAAARQLLITLIVSGFAIEIVVVLVSYFMAEEAIKPVREAYTAQKVFIANASHEIKTPLAAISANLEAADIKDNKWIKNVEMETARLTELNSSLLTLARTDLMTETKAEDVSLVELTRKTLDSFEPRLKNINLTVRMATFRNVKINAEDYRQILGVLIDNAIKYCDEKIVVKLSEHKLTVSNDGAKIAEDKLPHVFERFYQVDKSAEGVGLGLAIASSLAERNGWDLKAESGKMTTFTLSF